MIPGRATGGGSSWPARCPGEAQPLAARATASQAGAGISGTSRLPPAVLPIRIWRQALRSRAPCDSME